MSKLIEGKRKYKSAANRQMLFKSQNISHLGMNIINLPINITMSLVSHHTDNIFLIKFRKQQFPESFVACITSGWQTRHLHVLHKATNSHLLT